MNLWIDALFLGVASILCFAFYRYLAPGYSTLQVSNSAIFLASALGWFGSWPHFSATIWRLYESEKTRQAYFLSATLIPALVLFATAACFYYPVSFAPYFLKLFILWSPYHFSSQTFGLTLVYSRRAGLTVSKLTRRALAVFFVSSFLVQYTQAEISLKTAFMYAISYPQFPLPSITPLACQIIMYAALAVLAVEFIPQFRARKSVPWIVVLPLFTQYLWFVHGSYDISFQLLLPLFHGIQYLLIAWSLEMHRAKQPLRGSLLWFGANFACGALLFFGVPRLLAFAGWDLQFSTLIILAAVSIHHYFIDGVIWKLHRAESRSPLFRNVAWAWRRHT